MKRVLTVGCEIPGGYEEYVDFYSKTSLLDADIVLFQSTLRLFGWRPFDIDSSLNTDPESNTQAISHWRQEFAAVLEAGNTLFVLLSPFERVSLRNGGEATNYDVFHPLISKNVGVAEGSSMLLDPGESLLRDYWRQFGDYSQYQVYLQDSKHLRPLVNTRHGNRLVGAIYRHPRAGALVALPWLDLHRRDFFREDDDSQQAWTVEAVAWGERYLKTLESLDKAIRSQHDRTPAPQWVQDHSLKTTKEIVLSQRIHEIQAGLSNLEQKRQHVELEFANAGSFKALLFEQGRTLEATVLEAMRLLGFKANNYRDSDSEFDVILECPEGRCIGEIEGRDNKPIAIEKMRQLEINIYEDLDREEISEPAKAILFGNAFRLTPPSDRPVEHFTAKCVSAAERTNTALVRTCDLFEVARALVDKPDSKFAASCRKAILNTSGEEVKFPTPPGSDAPSHGNEPS